MRHSLRSYLLTTWLGFDLATFRQMFRFGCQQYMFTLHVSIILLFGCVSDLRQVFSKCLFWWYSAYFHSALYPSFCRKKSKSNFPQITPWQLPHSTFRKISLPYVTYIGGQIFKSSADEFPVMLKAEDICGQRLGLCWCADIDIGLAPLSESPTKR